MQIYRLFDILVCLNVSGIFGFVTKWNLHINLSENIYIKPVGGIKIAHI